MWFHQNLENATTLLYATHFVLHICTSITLNISNLGLYVLTYLQILQVHAEDGDKGNPREVRYGLVSEGNPFTSFFDINDTSGKFFFVLFFFYFSNYRYKDCV